MDLNRFVYGLGMLTCMDHFAIMAAYPPKPKRWGFSAAFLAFSFCWTLRATTSIVFFCSMIFSYTASGILPYASLASLPFWTNLVLSVDLQFLRALSQRPSTKVLLAFYVPSE
jgi:hypothetical protein